MGQAAGQRQIYITIESGDTQSQELFDYSASDNKITTSQLMEAKSYLVHDGEELSYQKELDLYPPLFSLTLEPSRLELTGPANNEQALWKVLQPGEVYPLEPGTLLKLGKLRLRLREVVDEEKEMTEKDPLSMSMYQSHHLEVKSISGGSEGSTDRQCRICFDGFSLPENPLVSLCRCSGSVKYIHYKCLKDWVTNNNVVRRENNASMFYSFKQTRCELCHEYYKPEFTYKGRKYMLLDLENAPNPPYALFEGGEQEQEGRFAILMVSLAQPEITVGRNSNCNVVMKEISVSRNHCVLTYHHKQLFVKDKGSKFGTLVRLAEEVEFSPTQGLQLQYESKLITIHEKGRLHCCCAESDTFLLKLTAGEQVEGEEEEEASGGEL